jgi:hypothetical protein
MEAWKAGMHRSFARGLSFAALLAVCGHAEALDRRVRIVNDSTHPIVGFYGTNVSARDWQDSLLGTDTLKPGASVVLDFEDGSGYCRFRFRAVFDDGKELVRQSINVCEVGTYRYTD